MILEVKVVPKSSTCQILGWEGTVLRVKVKGVPEDDEVNNNLIGYLSDYFDIPKSAVSIAFGRSSRMKKIAIAEEFSQKVKNKLMLIF